MRGGAEGEAQHKGYHELYLKNFEGLFVFMYVFFSICLADFFIYRIRDQYLEFSLNLTHSRVNLLLTFHTFSLKPGQAQC